MLKYVNNMSQLYFSAKLEDTKQPLPLLLVLPYSVEEGEEDNNDNVDSGRTMGAM
jgi:hypothetical protein